MLDRGYLRIARPRGVELRVHWSVLAGALLVARLRLEPLVWLGYLGVLLVHQLGHTGAVAAAGGSLVGLDTTLIGGSCRWRGTGSLLERAWVAWGGVLGQALLLGGALIFGVWLGGFRSGTGEQLRYCFVDVNVGLLALNLLPFAPLDGALAWRLFGELKSSQWTLRQALLAWVWRWARRRRERRQEAPGSRGAAEDAPAPAAGAPLGLPASPAEPPFTRARNAGTPDSESYGQATTDDAHEVEEEPLSSPRPSEQAQREIDALLRRVEDRAARSRRGR